MSDYRPSAGMLLRAAHEALAGIRDGRVEAHGMNPCEYARLYLEISPEGVEAAIEGEAGLTRQLSVAREVLARLTSSVKTVVNAGTSFVTTDEWTEMREALANATASLAGLEKA